MEKENLLKELREKFDEARNELSFKSTFDDIENIFFIEDAILQEKFVSDKFSRQLCARILNTYNSWLGYLHNFVSPNPQNIFAMMEAKMLDEQEKQKVSDIVKKIVGLTSTNSLIGLTKDKKLEAEFIDEAVNLWKDYFKPEMIKIMTKINNSWREEKSKGEN